MRRDSVKNAQSTLIQTELGGVNRPVLYLHVNIEHVASGAVYRIEDFVS
jgi:hypothetical protein